MQIYDLIKFRDDLIAKTNLLKADNSIKDLANIIDSIISENPMVDRFEAHEKISYLANRFNQLHDQSIEIKNDLEPIVDIINNAIDRLAVERTHKPDDTPFKNYYLTDFNVSDDVNTVIKSRIHRYTEWHFPGMQLTCRNTAHTAELVASDPLYLCDFNMEFIDTASQQFNHIYNNRLRKYVIVDHDLSVLPHNQFGFILAWMLFNYTGAAVIKLYLESIIKLLRPGGILMFSYNNCDLKESARLAERSGMSYITKRELSSICREIGYEIVSAYDLDNNDDNAKYISWLEIKKPGVLATIKRAQAKGQILTK